MEYHLELGPWGQIFPVPCALVDRHLKLAGREQLQVLLWALRHAGEGFSSQGLAQALDLSEESAQESLEYWADRGLLAETAPGELCPVPQPEAPAPFAPAPPPAPAP
ncbi:MAG: helicase DnaB, partial [Acutalibacter sp.]|nr:helicase DnaB [Acutalibacter sp.]